MFLVLVALFILVPIVEIAAIIWVGGQIGVLPTIALLIADSIAGAWLMKTQGRAAWIRFNTAIAERRVPAKEVVDGGLVIFGGALLLTPGFVTDIFGALFLIPPTRAVIRRLTLWRFGGPMVVAATGAMGRQGMPKTPRGRRASRRDPGARRPADVDSTATEIDP
jgi:UPF0716 protein FxsA